MSQTWPDGLSALCGDRIAPGCEHRMTGGCLPGCFAGPCEWEPFCLGYPCVENLDEHFPRQGTCTCCWKDARHKVLDEICEAVAAGMTTKEVSEAMGLPWPGVAAVAKLWDRERAEPKKGSRYRSADGRWRSV
jgi:bacterioferritin-associated ferredoxin